MNRLCDLLGIDIPIIQAPVGSIAGSELASAVSMAGGLGGLGVTWTTANDLVQRIGEIRTSTNRPFYVNYALAFPPETLDLALSLDVPIVTFSWGIEVGLINKCHQHGALVGIQVGNSGGARLATYSGADFVILQGLQAGGHVQSTTHLSQILEQVIQMELGIPIVVAGGISTGEDIAEWISTGADGVMLGTRFVATAESLAHDRYKGLLCAAKGSDTALTNCFDGGWPFALHRVLRNSTFDTWEAQGSPHPGSRPGEGETVALSSSSEPILRYEDTAPRAGMTGHIESMCCYSGMGVGNIGTIKPAGELVQQLWSEASKLLKR